MLRHRSIMAVTFVMSLLLFVIFTTTKSGTNFAVKKGFVSPIKTPGTIITFPWPPGVGWTLFSLLAFIFLVVTIIGLMFLTFYLTQFFVDVAEVKGEEFLSVPMEKPPRASAITPQSIQQFPQSK